MASSPPHLVVGTAGHVDHGKTSLVKALTGVDTDRLPEEKRRGITLELGFTHLTLDDGVTVGVVDVPGHERFVKAMAAGAAGLDLVLLVVAADEGVMPQTREHLDICQALGVQGGVVVVSKADLLPGLGAAHRAALDGQLAALVKGTVLERAPVVAVSASRGAGLAALRATLSRALAGVTPRPADGPLFLPIDRVFTVKGHGTVVTGTLAAGAVAAAQAVRLEPGGLERAVRGLQVHGVQVGAASAGQRVAVNLKGLEVQHVSRGMAVVAPGELGRVLRLDVELAPRPGVQLPP
ncbi:MAG: selenocysteine-specific translation elongation factor, partial [Myxococcaceae bacterium]|nr:selenocysteine-specific translation elongation factor [Myxococcaceae bacterium]